MPEFYMILARKMYKIPEFYMIFAWKMPEFYIIIAGKIFFPILGGHVPPISYSYAYGCISESYSAVQRVDILLTYNRLLWIFTPYYGLFEHFVTLSLVFFCCHLTNKVAYIDRGAEGVKCGERCPPLHWGTSVGRLPRKHSMLDPK